MQPLGAVECGDTPIKHATLTLLVRAGAVVHSAGEWHIIGSEEGEVYQAIHRFTGEIMDGGQLNILRKKASDRDLLLSLMRPDATVKDFDRQQIRDGKFHLLDPGHPQYRPSDASG